MKISEYISRLEKLKEMHGDLSVQEYGVMGERRDAREPGIGFALILQGRERKPRFWASYEAEDLRGEMVVRL